jgi:hypothetical protein
LKADKYLRLLVWNFERNLEAEITVPVQAGAGVYQPSERMPPGLDREFGRAIDQLLK